MKGCVCSRCGRPIRATKADPAVSAPSLGRGVQHWECAQRTWGGSADIAPPVQDDLDEIADFAIGVLEAGLEAGNGQDIAD